MKIDSSDLKYIQRKTIKFSINNQYFGVIVSKIQSFCQKIRQIPLIHFTSKQKAFKILAFIKNLYYE